MEGIVKATIHEEGRGEVGKESTAIHEETFSELLAKFVIHASRGPESEGSQEDVKGETKKDVKLKIESSRLKEDVKPIINEIQKPIKFCDKSLVDYGFHTSGLADSAKKNIFSKVQRKRKKGKDVSKYVQMNLHSYLSTGMERRILKHGQKLLINP